MTTAVEIAMSMWEEMGGVRKTLGGGMVDFDDLRKAWWEADFDFSDDMRDRYDTRDADIGHTQYSRRRDQARAFKRLDLATAWELDRQKAAGGM